MALPVLNVPGIEASPAAKKPRLDPIVLTNDVRPSSGAIASPSAPVVLRMKSMVATSPGSAAKTPASSIGFSISHSSPSSPGSVIKSYGSSPLTAVASTPLVVRIDKFSKLLGDALVVGVTCVSEELRRSANAVARRVAECLPRESDDAKDVVMVLVAALSDLKNEQLRLDVIEGRISPQTLVTMNERDLVCPEVQQRREQDFQERNKAKDWSELKRATASSSTLFQCPKCETWDSSWEQKQTRSGDEPMTVSCTCNKCSHAWKIY